MKNLLSKIPSISILVLIMLLISTTVLPFTPAKATDSDPEFWAVFIGISDYAELDDLNCCDDDARDFFDTFKSFCPENHMKLLVDSGAKQSSIIAALTWLDNNADSDDTVVFTFSGHSDGDLIATYNSANNSYANYIESDQLNTFLNNINAKEVVTILDCCHAEGLISGGSHSNRVNLLASSRDEGSWDDPKLGNGVYSFYVILAINLFISTPNDTVDSNIDYSLSFNEIYEYASSQTREYEMNDPEQFDPIQHPKISGNGDSPLLDKIVVNTNDFSDNPISLNVTLDSIDHSLFDNVVFPCYPDSVHIISVPDTIEPSGGGKYTFTGWSGINGLIPLSVSKGSYTAIYQEEKSLAFIYVIISITVVVAIVITIVVIRRRRKSKNERVSVMNENTSEYTQAPFNMEKDPVSGLYSCKVCHSYSVWYNSYKGQFECLNPNCPNFNVPLRD
jgi:hypothetical protein